MVEVRDEPRQSLEDALAKTESDSESVLKTAAAVNASLKRVRAAAQAGDLRALGSAMDATEQAITALRQEFATTKHGWDFNEDAYFSNGAFSRELREMAQQMDLRVFEQDDRLYCYPALIRVLPNERTVLIDKTRERRLRPSVLVARLKDLQKRPPRFKPEAFLEALFSAYSTVVAKNEAKRGNNVIGQGAVVKLLDVYDLLTLLPGQAKEYSRQEFARDIYLLDQSGVTTPRKGHSVVFPASTGTRTSSNTIRIVTQTGQEKLYYGIAFHSAG
ncbi:MAG: hypothetical protein ACRDJN_16035 [Chloroflexota bacterium]